MDAPSSKLAPPSTKAATSVARVEDAWYVVCRSSDLRRRPLSRTLLGTPLVVFRDATGAPRALLDRCAHRNLPLSLGRVVEGQLECGYHGWRFDGQGACRRVPGLCRDDGGTRCVPAHATREQDGFVWVYGRAGVAEPSAEPFRFPLLGEPGYTTVREVVEARGSVHAVAENALDVPHTAFLHQGLFRSPEPRGEIDVIVRRWHDRVEAEFVGEPRPSGLAAWILAPRGGEVVHFDRFFLPGVVQVEYRLGETSHFCVTSALTPLEDHRTRLFAAISFRIPLPGWLVTPILKPVGRRIFAQDAEVLARQSEAIERFGGEQFMSTEVDVLGPSILRLLRSAERGPPEPFEEPVTKQLRMAV